MVGCEKKFTSELIADDFLHKNTFEKRLNFCTYVHYTLRLYSEITSLLMHELLLHSIVAVCFSRCFFSRLQADITSIIFIVAVAVYDSF